MLLNITVSFQKLYKFINSVELISPQHTAKELVHTLRQGQIASLFQKSVRRVSLPFMHPQHAQVSNLFTLRKLPIAKDNISS